MGKGISDLEIRVHKLVVQEMQVKAILVMLDSFFSE